MAENSKIEWTTHTFNPWRGCTKVSAGCANCYAETMSGRNPGTLGVWGPSGTRVVASEAMWKQPLKWNNLAANAYESARLEARAESSNPCDPDPFEFEAPERPRVFCASLADVFEDWAGDMHLSNGDIAGREVAGGGSMKVTIQDVRNRLFALIDATPHLDWLLLTKRPENIAKMMPEWKTTSEISSSLTGPNRKLVVTATGGVRPNLWLGTSVENQQTADERIPHLLRVPAKVRFLSMEPLLGPVDLGEVPIGMAGPLRPGAAADAGPRIDWVIVGGESGHGARPMHPEWVRSIRDQCQTAGVAFFFKQWGDFAPRDAGGFFSVSDKTTHTIDELGRLDVKQGGGQLVQVGRIGKKNAGRLLDGREWSEFPEAIA